MTTNETDRPTELLPRLEPHFSEGREMPRPGRLTWIRWGVLVVVLVAAVAAACWTDMVVERPVSGSVVGTTGEADERIRVAFIVAGQGAVHLAVGQPVRLEIAGDNGWGVLVRMEDASPSPDRPHVRATAAIVGPERLLRSIPGQACAGHVQVGFIPAMRGLWRLATSQLAEPSRSDPAELRRRIPAELTATGRYGRIERGLGGRRTPSATQTP